MNAKHTSTVAPSGTKRVVLIALITSLTCILAPLSIPLPISPVPITLGNLILLTFVYVLGRKDSIISYIAYLLIGLTGIPVFSGFTGGFGKLMGPTGGYLIGFLFMILIAGSFVEAFEKKPFIIAVGMILANLLNYLFGTLWLSYQLGISFLSGLSICVLPYITGDVIKAALAMLIGPILAKRISRIRTGIS